MDQTTLLAQIEIARDELWNELEIGYLGLETLPPEIGQLTTLRELDLSENRLTSLPESMQRLTALESLDLTGNQLSRLPAWLGKLTNLKFIYLSNNRLTTLPESLGELTDIRELYLSDNLFGELPEWLGSQAALYSLGLSNNRLSRLPEWLGRLSALQYLDLSGNQLSTLPEWIRRLTALRHLYLDRNQLSELPKGLGKLRMLESLDLSSNLLSALPSNLSDLTRLENLDLAGNPSLGVPAEILTNTRHPEAILDYYSANIRSVLWRVGLGTTLNEVKILLLGEGGVGKTSLTRRLVDKAFDPGESPTTVVNIRDWQREINGENFTAHLWDFGGQKIMHATHEFFLRSRSIYLVAIDARTGVHACRLHYWLGLAATYGDGAPTVIVVNKTDLHQQLRLDEHTLHEQYPFIVGVVYTSAKDNENIDQLTVLLDKIIGSMPEARIPFSDEWDRVRQRVQKEAEKARYLSQERYIEICQLEGITQSQTQLSLLKTLDRLGSALWFGDFHTRLEDLYVLDPNWVTDGVYRIVTFPDISAAGGTLRLDHLPTVLPPDEYPRARQRLFIVDLMYHFELAFPYTGGERYLIPNLLPEQTPKIDWDMANSLLFEYQYKVLPESVFARLMMRAHRALVGDQYWRRGFVLDDGRNRALVRAYPDDQIPRLTIAVGGLPGSRGELMDKLRFNLMTIHESIKGLDVNGFVPIPGYPKAEPVAYDSLLWLREEGREFAHPGLKKVFDPDVLLRGLENRITQQTHIHIDYLDGDVIVDGDKIARDSFRIERMDGSTGVFGDAGRIDLNAVRD